MDKFVYNYVLITGVISWCAAQIIKTILHFVQTKTFSAERLLGAGGMPSSHSAMVCSAAVAMCKLRGAGSPEFALIFLFAMIVMYDAMGVRRSAGLHAREINKINRIFEKKGFSCDNGDTEENNDKKKKELKEFLGHTPLEVIGGALLGILIAMIVPMEI